MSEIVINAQNLSKEIFIILIQDSHLSRDF